MTNERLQVNMRLERDLIDELDAVAEAQSLDRAELARRLLRDGVRRERIELGLRGYRAGDVSLGRAAEIAHVSLYEMIDRVHDAGVPYELDKAEIDHLRGTGAHRRAPAMARDASVRYGATPPDASSGIDDLRDRFRPDSVRWLFVGESSPAGGTHFYRADSNLFRATQAAFVEAFGAEVPTGPAFLHWFRDRGGWLVDLADRPVDRLASAERDSGVAAGVTRLARTIAETGPEMIVCVKASIAEAVRSAAAEAGFTGSIAALPFPVRKWRTAFISGLATALRQHETDSGSRSRP